MNENTMHYAEECFGQNVIQCPRCNFEFIHHLAVEIFDRVEDKAHGLYINVSDRKLNVASKLPKGNPSKRRDGLRILFGCEGCRQVSSLIIYQHKGTTVCEWEIDKDWVEETKKWAS